MNLIDRVVAAEQRSAAQSAQALPTWAYGERFYFQMRLYRKTETVQPDGSDSWTEVKTLTSGESYVLRVTADFNPDHCTADHAVMLSGDVELLLNCEHGLVLCEQMWHRVVPDQCLHRTYDYPIKVSPEYAGDRVTFEVGYCLAGQKVRPIPISKLQIFEKTAWLHAEHPTWQVVLDAGARDTTRILQVKQSTSTTYHVRSYWDEVIDYEGDIHKPVVSPAQFMRKNQPPSDIICRIKERSAENPRSFEDWLKKKLRTYGDRFCLIILDESDEYDMAWEFIHVRIRPTDDVSIAADLQGEVPIGALFPIVRWLPDLKFHGDYLALLASETLVQGDVVAYLDLHDTAHIEVEKQILAQFDAELFGTFEPFQQRLQGSLSQTALVYLGCHGQIIVDNANEQDLFLGSFQTEEQFTVYTLAGLEFHEPVQSRPLVMVNACHSAYTVRKDSIRHGLPVTFLRRVAREFLGTIGPVGSEFAVRFAETLLTRAGEEGGIRLATALHEQRAAIVRSMRQQPNVEGWFDYLYTFMYVYYGSPLTSLHLRPAIRAVMEVEA